MKIMVQLFVDGADVDFAELQLHGLIKPHVGGYVLTHAGKSYLG